ncbi:hypothetical protein C8R47DRAFT_1070172 [Mycena vitilis]|nr:hypothetical protein C8R47DRAFT_1070172 [Mycena vitilis]
MATMVVRLLRPYTREFVLGGLTSAVCRVVLSYTASSASVVNHPEAPSGTSVERALSQPRMPCPVSACCLFSPIQAISHIEPLPGSQILASPTFFATDSSSPAVTVSSDLPQSLPIILFVLAGIYLAFLLVMKVHRPQPDRSIIKSVDGEPTLARKPSNLADCPIPRNTTFTVDALQSAAASPINLLPPSSDRPTIISPGVSSKAGELKTKTTSEAIPAHAVYVPPHKRPGFNLDTRPPFGVLANDKPNVPNQEPDQKRHCSSKQLQPLGPDSRKMWHRASVSDLSAGTAVDIDLRSHARAHSSDFINTSYWENRVDAQTLDVELERAERGNPNPNNHWNSAGDTDIDIDTLRSEINALKDANKALSLYESKIIDRIISQEGFEGIFAVDHEEEVVPDVRFPAILPLVKPRPQSVDEQGP